MPDIRAGLARLLRPASVAIVGASPNNRVGLVALNNQIRLGFPGDVYVVHPRLPEVDGVPAWPALRALPTVPDAVFIALGAERATDVFEECAELGVGGAVIVAGGFAEGGPPGIALQERLRDAARRSGTALAGPNGMGIVSPAVRSALYMARIGPELLAGRVGAIAESGTVAGALLNNRRGVRFSHVVSSGNEAVVEAADLLDFFAEDPATGVIIAFLETIRSPERFVAAVERCHAAGKPVVVLKSGRTDAARTAAAAHTGALAYPDRLVDAFFRRHGVLRVDTLEEVLECAVLLEADWRPGCRVAHVTLSGGQNELLLDAMAGLPALRPADLAPETVTTIRAAMPPYGPIANPFDAWNLVDWNTSYPPVLEAIAADPGVDAVIAWSEAPAVYTTSSPDLTRRVGAAAVAAHRATGKPVALGTTLWGSVDAELAQELATEGVPIVSGVRHAAVALDRVIQHAAYISSPAKVVDARHNFGTEPFAGWPALQLLAEAGVPVVPTAVVADAAAAERAAEQLGYPVVVKAGDPRVLHRTEVGGVALNLADAAAVRAAAERISGELLVQAQVSGGQEVILGLQRQPGLGTFVLLGLGGIWAEVLDDVAVRKVPLLPGEAHTMVHELRALPLLHGARGREALDIDALAEAVEKLAALGARLGPALSALDVNPVVVLPKGVLALDALVVPATVE